MCMTNVCSFSDDASRLLVCIGYGFYVELTHDETRTFVDRRIRLLQTRLELANDEANRIRDHIDVAMHTLAQLHSIT